MPVEYLEKSRFSFINKMEDANDFGCSRSKRLGIATCSINWPIGSGKKFHGVYDRDKKKVLTFSDTMKGRKEGIEEEIDIDDPHLLDVEERTAEPLDATTSKGELWLDLRSPTLVWRLFCSTSNDGAASAYDRHIVDETYAGDIIGLLRQIDAGHLLYRRYGDPSYC